VDQPEGLIVLTRGLACVAAVAGTLVALGCGDDATTTSDPPFRPGAKIEIDAPTSIDSPLQRFVSAEELVTEISFAGSDFHAQQIRDGLRPDLYLADNTALPAGLFDDGLVREPVPLATDELVIAVPKDSEIESVDDLADAGVTVSIGQDGLPAGDYARDAISELEPGTGDAILANASDEQSNNNGIAIAVASGKADAGFVYGSDVQATGGKLRSIELPAEAQQEVVITGAVVEGADNHAGAQHVIDGLLTGDGARRLARAGFGPPPDHS
jgi:molybdate transport system substrate-binding protein